ncbi:hypothetical protein FJV41_04635 [Myxococcus llanfairpwllgwyngyllgogerychwyrndrobwllllantysiliogogogochensis]|uniref:Zinc-finger domain-containing protein n=1 Tax=Myxococcus llanfairpwllgwyngyllgogerychwyrndrobwllllantysiliogogogochensis TaxID=2590453 RepID=A0A540X7E6_9BACT|nr:hypothetical protein [Myxococcus llanfairpwllgwyngyllgogerychwyrndrobwllllantysiliogogogochensis]TQF17221.1 hypothetical protein FJV41_04635 [Myxococcus llanfairpwllgwyngyllgogerychwyrndrobwllllantysiliogogogochensis]
MALFTQHVDRQLVHLANEGVLPPRQWSRVLRHARGCARCGARYERVMNLRRMFASDTVTVPTPGELASLESRGLASVLATVEREPSTESSGQAARADRLHKDLGEPWSLARRLWARVLQAWNSPSLGHVGGAWVVSLMAAAGLLWLSLPSDTTEWGARGEGQGATVMRLFCVPAEAELREVRGQGDCPAGAALAFAAGARAPYTHVVVTVRTDKGLKVEGPFEVKASPGAEAALDLTPRLPDTGEVELTAVFASSASDALAAARGEPVRDVVRVQHRVRIAGKP